MSSYHAKDITWHHFLKLDDRDIVHQSDKEAWKEFNHVHSNFASNPKNIRLGLCTYRFSPFDMSSNLYSCWPIIVIVYNLPHWKCMTRSFMFSVMMILGPKNMRKKLDIFLRLFIDELNKLWSIGVKTYGVYRKENVQLKPTLILTISDFSTYGMLSGLSIHNKLSCSYCMEHNKTFKLKHRRNFFCHRRFLPLNHLYRYQSNKIFKWVIERLPHLPHRFGLEMLYKVYKFT